MEILIEKKGEYCISCMKPESSYDLLVKYNNGQGSGIPLCLDCLEKLGLAIMSKVRAESIKSCKNCACREVCSKKLDLEYSLVGQDCRHYFPQSSKNSAEFSDLELTEHKLYREYSKNLATVEKETSQRVIFEIIKLLNSRKEALKVNSDSVSMRGIDWALLEVKQLAKSLGVESER